MVPFLVEIFQASRACSGVKAVSGFSMMEFTHFSKEKISVWRTSRASTVGAAAAKGRASAAKVRKR